MAFRRYSAVLAVAGSAAFFAPAAAQLPTVMPDDFVALSQRSGSAVDCGGHYAENCASCTQGNGEMWCNGECLWYPGRAGPGQCALPTPWGRLVAYTKNSFWVWYHCMPAILMWGLCMGIYACIYKKKVVDEIPGERIENNDDPEFDNWKDREMGLCDCWYYPSQCCWATFCTPVVAGKNYATGQVAPFWPACCMVFVGIYSLFWPVFCCMALVRTMLSGKLQRNLRFKPNCCLNFFTTLFCFPCEIARESVEVNYQLGVEIKCPFEVETSVGAKLSMFEESVDRTCARSCRACT